MMPNSNCMLSLAVFLLALSLSGAKCPEECRCSLDDRGRRKVTCSRGGMRDTIPIGEMAENTQILIVTAPPSKPNHLSLGPIFKGLPKLEEMHIMWSAVPNIGAHSFWGLKDLRVLNLTHNSLSTLMDTNFKGVGSLKQLDLSCNKIESVPSAVFRYVRHLHSLSLAHNRISSLVTRIFFGLTRLEHLDLSYNPIGELQPELFSDVPALKKFSCAACELTIFSENIIRIITDVKDLNLRDNRLTQIPQALSSLTNLLSLRFDGNQVTRIDENTFTESPVTHVHLAHNDITSIEENAFSNSTLTHLDLSYNRLSDVSSGGFPDVFQSLRELQLSGNPLQTEKLFELLSKAKQLHHLGLGDIGLSSVPNIIGRGRGLHSLNFSSNYISVLPHELFSSSPHLRLLDISHNKFEGISDDVLDAITEAKDLRILRLEGNPWQCDQCHVGPLLRWLQRSPDQESGCDEPKVWTCLLCIGPEEVKQQPLALLPPGDLPKCQTPPTKASLSLSDPSSKSMSINPGSLLDDSGREYIDVLDELKIAPPLADQPVYFRNGVQEDQAGGNSSNNIFKENIMAVSIGFLSFLIILVCLTVFGYVIYYKRSTVNLINEHDGGKKLFFFRKKSAVTIETTKKKTETGVTKSNSKCDSGTEDKSHQMTELKLDENLVSVTASVTATTVGGIRETELI